MSQDNCDHKFIDSKRCLKCGWEPYEFFIQDERHVSGKPWLHVSLIKHLAQVPQNYGGRFLDAIDEPLSDACIIDLRFKPRLIFIPPAYQSGDHRKYTGPCLHKLPVPGTAANVCTECGWAPPEPGRPNPARNEASDETNENT